MIKLFRVILSLDPREFISGAAQAGQILTGFRSALELVRIAFDTLAGAARAFWDTFISGVVAEEKVKATLARIIGDGALAAKTFEEMEAKAKKFGVSSDELAPGVIQLANALKALDGSVDPAKLDKYTDAVIGLSRRTGTSFEQSATAISRALAGDFGLLQRSLGISLDSMEGLSDKAKEVLGNTQAASDEALGSVTKVIGSKVTNAEDALSTLDEIFQKLSISASEGSDTVDANLTKIQERFDDLKERVGEKILPYLNEALDKFIKFFDENEDTINRFADAFGDMLGRLAEGGLDALLDQMQNFDPANFEKLIDSINSVDWKSVAAALNTTAGFVNTVGSIGGAKDTSAIGKSTNAVERAGAQTGEQLRANATSGERAFNQQLENILKSIGINITVGVDEEGQLNVKKVARKEVSAGIGELADSISGKGSKRSGGQ